MRGGGAVIGAVLAALVLAGCGSAGEQQDGAPRASVGGAPSGAAGTALGATGTPPTPALPAGWRWESFRDAEVAVPAGWGYGTTGTPWCGGPGHRPRAPYVGRPGGVFDVGCLPAGASFRDGRVVGGTDRSTSAAVAGTFVWFSGLGPWEERTPGPPAGDRVTVAVGSAVLQVQARADLRTRILATAHVITTDANGCPASHPITGNARWRPQPATAVEFAPPQQVSVCRYGLGWAGAGLISSTRIIGPAGADALAAATMGDPVRRSTPKHCRPQDATGGEAIVLRAGLRQVVMRYAGCAHDGFDDGSDVRPLTRAKVAPFVTGANATRVSARGMGTYDPRSGRA